MEMRPLGQHDPQTLAAQREGVYRFLLYLAQNREVADEITQETFRVALSKGTMPENEEELAAWLRAIAKNLLWNHWRKQNTPWLLFSSEVVELAERRFIETSAESQDRWESRQKAVLSCIKKLPDASRALLLRRYQSGEGIGQMASAIGIKPKALGKRLDRIRQWLRDCINAFLKEQ
jgi:RNA polymerase sigma-70 factor (ECF subfamily)